MTVAVLTVSIMASDNNDIQQRKKLAEQLLIKMEVPQSMTKTFNMIFRAQVAQMNKMRLNAAQKATALKVQKETMELLQKELSWNNIKSSIISVYAETFSVADLKAIIAFYSSPAGKKFVQKQPELQQRMMAMQMNLMQKLQPKIMAIVKKYSPKGSSTGN